MELFFDRATIDILLLCRVKKNMLKKKQSLPYSQFVITDKDNKDDDFMSLVASTSPFPSAITTTTSTSPAIVLPPGKREAKNRHQS
jgi:hypothetical protein